MSFQELERGVNLYWEELLAKNRSPLYLLSGLFHRALVDWEMLLSAQWPELFPGQDKQITPLTRFVCE